MESTRSMTMTTGVGTPYYMAPEMMTNNRHYSTAVDVYSYGIMAAQVINGKLEYEGNPEFDSIYGVFFTIQQTYLC